MKLYIFLQNNRLFVHYLTFVIFIIGVMALLGLQREARPNVNFNRVAISAVFPGASPSDIEELIIDPIEEKISEVEGIEEYRSVSFLGAGAISVKIDERYPNQGEIVDEVRRKVSEVRNLPAQVEDPIVREIKANNIPVLRMAIYGDLADETLKLEIEKLKDFLKQFPSVQSVEYTGLSDLQLKILSDPKKLEANDVTLIEVADALSAWATKKPGGLLESKDTTRSITIGSDYNTKELLENFVVRSNDAYRSIKLSDVADIEFGLEDMQRESLYAGKKAVLVTVVKKPFADSIETVDSIRAELDEYIKSFPPGLKYTIYSDESERVRDRLGTVSRNAIFGLMLVLILLVLFLDWRSAIVTSIGIPVAILGGLILLYLLGNTLNTLVLVGMIVVLGMLVDDAIVVCENIYTHIEAGLSPREAALKGVSEISGPVIATVLTTIFSFMPILFMKEIIGQFLRVIPLTVICMLFVSLLEVLLILPVHSAELMKSHKKSRRNFFHNLEEKYRRYLDWSINNKFKILAGVLVLLLGSAVQGRNLFSRFTLFPATGLEGLSVRVELPKNSPLKQTSLAIGRLSQQLTNSHNSSFESIFSTIGEVRTGGSSGSQQNAPHLGVINIEFTSDPDFIHQEKKVLKSIQSIISQFSKENNIKTSITIDRPGPPVGKPIQLQVTSRDINFGSSIVTQIKEELAKVSGVHSLETDLDGDTKATRFEVNDLYAASSGVNPAGIARTVFAATTGIVANEVLINNEKVELLVGVKNKKMLDTKSLLNLKLPDRSRLPVPLSAFVTVKDELGPSSIQRLNGLRTITLFGEVDENIITGKEANSKIRPLIAQLKKQHPTISIETAGGEKDRMSALSDTIRLYALALILVFMTISLAFRSLIYPFFVLLSIPMGLVGVVWSLTFHDMPLSLMGLVGVVGLSGVVVNVSIILIKFVQERVNEGVPYNDALIQAGVRRLRPIIITTITTLIGLIPLIYGFGGVDTFVQPLALVLGWGLFVATGLTLFTLPALMAIFPWLGRLRQ